MVKKTEEELKQTLTGTPFEELPAKFEGINESLGYLENEFSEFFDSIDGDPELLFELKTNLEDFVEEIKQIKSDWLNYQESLYSKANSIVGETDIHKRTSFEIVHEQNYIRIKTETKVDEYTTNLCSIDLFRDIVKYIADRGSTGVPILSTDIYKELKSTITSRSKYRKSNVITYRIFNLLMNEGILEDSPYSNKNGQVLTKNKEEVIQWLDTILAN